ncbi:major facilitator superfamily transporter multidrug resistance [Sporothrix brasiliensis 5110]|uniref:Major facilitator superfamily transporter multidrug resistance n=1 Tax=Sporothrix brasiliensis 5110 TaxID=1398154 RepID=A0A0C2J5S8_9PEZI|nr:major facilitator superfamily transporter multidrug resistance [Sporothrix brasiliensis 5110]KIH94350.1 major facilitator superfamily transporter multidrug resistance [Sporothrix brasiliensis 5110]
MACALAPNWAGFLVFRLLTGVFASAPIAVVTGILADVFGSARTRGRAMSMFMAMTVFGPLFAPIISGYCSATIGWRWTFWIALIYAGVSLVPLALLPETYGPILLKRRAVRMRKEDPKANIVAPHELEKKNLRELATIVLTRPLRMIASELIVSCVCIYLALLYAIFYMTFTAFPLVFVDIYKFSPGVEGLIFLAIGAGTLLSISIFYAYDNYLLNAIDRGEAWTKQEEYRRLPLACLGGPVFVISLFWLGWTARADISFVAPMLAGIPFGLGFMSAMAMFKRLTIPGACSLLGGLSLLMCAIPFVFIWKGEQIRAGSKFCIALRERKVEMQRKVEEQRQRRLLHAQQRLGQPLQQPMNPELQKETV